LRPSTLEEFVGQEHLVGEGKPLREAIEKKHAFSFILWGPPGVGKTTLARIYARALDAELYELSAVSAGKADIKAFVEKETDRQRVLFLDEIHRFNKAQQDFLLPYVESGELMLIGATTENPSFEVISALLSRCRVFTLHALTDVELATILERAEPALPEDALDWLVSYANGDARAALSLLHHTRELCGEVTVESLTRSLQDTRIRYDKKGDEHYDTISAFIKSMRASDPDAAIYYLARMIEGGEDPRFIARRMVVFASEDVGLAQPTALVVANAVFRACETIGYPECAINLAHGATYLAQAAKSRASYDALRAAQRDVAAHGNAPIPMLLRNAPTTLMKELGYGTRTHESNLPQELSARRYFTDEQ
jgi:putative ATPase